MASTNKTTNYNLSQFLGTDKPSWLGDINADMLKIDTGIHNAATTATGADGKADANTTAIGTLSSLTTTDKTDLVSAINEVNSTAGTAQNTANTAAGTATTANAGVTALDNYLTITGTNSYAYNNAAIVPTSVTSTSGTLYVAKNQQGTLGKIYGRIGGNTSNGWTTGKITINTDTGLRPDTDITIADAGIVTASANYNTKYVQPANIIVKTDGKIEIEFPTTDANDTFQLILTPSLYFIKNFGDVYDPGA